MFFKLKRAQRAHMHLFRLYRMQRVCECVWVAQTKQTPSVSSPLTSAASKPSLLHRHSSSENTLFEKKQETILEKDVITSQFTLPAFCYGVCMYVCVYMCVCMGVCVCVVLRAHQSTPSRSRAQSHNRHF